MDLTSDQFKLATKFVQDWFKDKKLELETTFGAGGVIDSTTFLQIAQRLRNKGFEVIPQDDRLSIITPNHIRLSLLGLGVLQQYCKDDTLEGKPFSAMFKDRAFPDSNLDLKEYDIRFKIRREEELSTSDPRVAALLTNWDKQK
jgi:DNA polymerase III sliding clamp (beta) subunit (PCNA family)